MIYVREHSFSTTREAAEFFGVSIRHVQQMRRENRLHNLGLGRACPKVYYKPRMSISVRGEVFADAEVCATHFGISINTVYAAVAKGRQDTIGLGAGSHGKQHLARSKPITLGGMTFPSMAAASRALGWRKKRLEQTLRRGKAVAKERLYAAILKHAAEQEAKARKERQSPSGLEPQLPARISRPRQAHHAAHPRE